MADMRILLLIIQFPPDVNSTGLLMDQVCEELRTYGHDIAIITSFPHYARFRVWDEYRGKLFEQAHHKDMPVLRLAVYASGSKQKMLHRLANYLSFNALAALAMLGSRRSYDVVFCTNGSFFTGVAAFVYGMVRGVPFVYNVQDLYPETPAQAGQLSSRYAVAILQQVARFMYHTAAHIAVITPAFRDYIVAQGVPEQKVSVIPNFVNTEFIRPLPKDNTFSRKHNLAATFVISHAGNIGYVYDLETMLEAAAHLVAYDDILFLIVGDGVAKPDLQRKAQAMKLPNVRFLPFQPHEDLPWLRATSDLQVSLYKYGSARNSMPSKVYEIMASGRPILASAEQGSDVRTLIETTACGLCVDPQNVRQLVAAIRTLYHNPELRAAMAERGRYYAEQQFSRSVVARQYHNLLTQVVQQTSSHIQRGYKNV
jgi:colanic acid biosynthesis glycosyl transferase WcaI